jgi:hypothetical protein
MRGQGDHPLSYKRQSSPSFFSLMPRVITNTLPLLNTPFVGFLPIGIQRGDRDIRLILCEYKCGLKPLMYNLFVSLD